MKFAIAGAGAVGAYIAALMARAGQDVTLLARGRQLEAIRARGVCVTGAAGEFTSHPAVTGDPACLGGSRRGPPRRQGPQPPRPRAAPGARPWW